MRIPFYLLIFSIFVLGFVIAWPRVTDLVVFAAPMVVASLYLLALAYVQKRREDASLIVVDGSNVMHWRDNTPDIATLKEVVGALRDEGFTPGVVFDANAGYKLRGRYLGDKSLSRILNLPLNRIMVVPKGKPADPIILTAARDMNARIVTNDRFRDWGDKFPEIGTQGHLIQGGYRDGALWLDL